MGEKIQSTIKFLEKFHPKNRILKIEAATKIDNCFSICQYKIEEPKNIETSTPFL